MDEQKFSVDKLYFRKQERSFLTPYIQTDNLHVTGCSYSSAIATNLALGYTLERAISKSMQFISNALDTAPDIGHGPNPINHKRGGENVEFA